MQESIDAMQQNISYINKIVVDLQDYARSLRPEMRVIDLEQFFVSFLSTVYVPEFIELGVDIKIDDKVRTDPTFLRRALTNLVTNAIQAMPPPKGGKLAIKAFINEKCLCITVSDTGHGIPDEIREKMFKPLVTTKSKGQGLGLAVVKRLVDALSGHITFESDKDKGTKFIIELPAQ